MDILNSLRVARLYGTEKNTGKPIEYGYEIEVNQSGGWYPIKKVIKETGEVIDTGKGKRKNANT